MRVQPWSRGCVVVVAAVAVFVVAGTLGCGNECRSSRAAAIHEDVGVVVDRVANRFRPAMVSVTFDDAGAGEELAADDLEARSMRGTFYFTSSFIDKDALHLTHAQAERIVAGEHEIGDHTITHPNLRRLEWPFLDEEIGGARDALDSLVCVADIRSFAPPFGATNDDVTNVVKRAGFASQRTVVRGYNLPDADPFQLKSNAINSAEQGFHAETPASVHQTLRDAIDAGGWFIVHFHMITEGTPALHIQYPRADMDAIFDDIASARDDGDVKVVTMAEGVDVMKQR